MKPLSGIVKLALLFAVIVLFLAPARQKLEVSVYPFIPNAESYYLHLEKEFEKQHPEIDLVVAMNYDHYEEQNGVMDETADVYEVDCLMLQDLIDARKIQSLNAKDFCFSDEDLMPAAKIVYQNNDLYGIPHWLCGNFLFCGVSDTALVRAKSLKTLETAIGSSVAIPEHSVSVDIKGKLNLAELYADALADQYVAVEPIKQHFKGEILDTSAIENLSRLNKLSFSDWARSDSYHKKEGFHARQFGKGNARAYIGRSESLYFLLQETEFGCHESEKCMQHSKIAVTDLPLSDKGAASIGWVDAFVVDKKCSGQNKKNAVLFVNFMISRSSYMNALLPKNGNVPSYLLPAFDHLYHDEELLNKAPLYRQFYRCAAKIQAFTYPGMIADFKRIGKSVDAKLSKNEHR